jgi:hypothetical protein
MRCEKRQKKTRMVNRCYEPDRLSPTRMVEAYEKIVPRHVRVLDEWRNETETKQVHEQLLLGG